MQYLLERLAAAGDPTPGPPRRPDVHAAVRAQIERVVSSHFWPGRAGLELMGMNLPPVAGFGYACERDTVRYAAGIRDLVVEHEPRLKGVAVDVEQTGSPLMPQQVVVRGVMQDGEAATFRFALPRRS